MLIPSRRNTLRPKVSPLGVVTSKSSLKSLDSEEYHGRSQPIRFLYARRLRSGPREIIANDVSRACRCASGMIWSATIEQPSQPAVGQPDAPGPYMKW